VIRVKRSRSAVVRAAIPVGLDERDPLSGREGGTCAEEPRPSPLMHRASHRGPTRGWRQSSSEIALGPSRSGRVSVPREARDVVGASAASQPAPSRDCASSNRDHRRVAFHDPRTASQLTHTRPIYRIRDAGAIGPTQRKRPRLRGHLLRERDSNARPSGYEPDELPLLHPAMFILSRQKAQRDPKKSSIQRAIRLVRSAPAVVALPEGPERSTAMRPSPFLTKS
jgi:hypothetical protein